MSSPLDREDQPGFDVDDGVAGARRRRWQWISRRTAVMAVAVAVCLVAIGQLSIGPINGWPHALVGAGLYIVVLVLVRSRWVRSGAASNARRSGVTRARRWFLWVALALGAFGLIVAAALMTTWVRPRDPVLMNPNTNCGSALVPRQFATSDSYPAQEVYKSIDGLLTGECTDGIALRRSQALLFAQFAAIALIVALLPRAAVADDPPPEEDVNTEITPTDGPDDDLDPLPRSDDVVTVRRSLLRHPLRFALPMVLLVAVIAAVLALRTRHQVTMAQEYDAQTAAWVAKYERPIVTLGLDGNALAVSITAKDFPAMQADCTTALADLDKLAVPQPSSRQCYPASAPT